MDLLLRRNKGIFLAVTDDELDDDFDDFGKGDADQDGIIYSCPTCFQLGIESILRKRIVYATTTAKNPGKKKDKVTLVEGMADLGLNVDEKDENNFRQCHRCGDIYSIKNLQNKREYNQAVEDYRDYKIHNWSPDAEAKIKQKCSISEREKQKLEDLDKKKKGKGSLKEPISGHGIEKETKTLPKKKGKIRQIPSTKRVIRL